MKKWSPKLGEPFGCGSPHVVRALFRPLLRAGFRIITLPPLPKKARTDLARAPNDIAFGQVLRNPLEREVVSPAAVAVAASVVAVAVVVAVGVGDRAQLLTHAVPLALQVAAAAGVVDLLVDRRSEVQYAASLILAVVHVSAPAVGVLETVRGVLELVDEPLKVVAVVPVTGVS